MKKGGYHTLCIGKMYVYPHHNRVNNVPYSESWFKCDDYLHGLEKKIGHKADIIDTGLGCNSWVARAGPSTNILDMYINEDI